MQTVFVRPSGRGTTIQMAGRVLRKCTGFAAKQIVQCRDTRHPFIKTATPRQQYLWQEDGWRSLRVNPKLDLCNQNACRVIAQTVVSLPAFVRRKQTRSKARFWREAAS
jgi:hypothetical protein